MPSIKTSELTGPALDWAVAQCEGRLTLDGLSYQSRVYMMGRQLYCTDANGNVIFYSPSDSWEQGGPVIEREGIGFKRNGKRTFMSENMRYEAYVIRNQDEDAILRVGFRGTGPTPLIAAMRCYVASKLGDTVEVPDDL